MGNKPLTMTRVKGTETLASSFYKRQRTYTLVHFVLLYAVRVSQPSSYLRVFLLSRLPAEQVHVSLI